MALSSILHKGRGMLKTREQVPFCSRCQYVESGYRPIPSSPLYCIKSVFSATNETANFWTHFIPFTLMLRRLHRIVSQLDDPYDSNYYLFYIHTFGVCFVLLVSSLAHMFCSASEWMHRLCFSFDYTAIFLFGVSAQIAFERCICPIRCFGIAEGFTADHYMWLIIVVCPIHILMICASQHPSVNNFVILRDIPFALEYALLNAPCVVRFALDDVVADLSDNNCFHLASSSSNLLLLQFSFTLIGMFVFASHIPEVFLPGYFDIVGQSHQIFHIFVATAMYFQNVLVESVMMEAKEKIEAGLLNADYLSITWRDTVGHFIIVFFVSNLITALYGIFVLKGKCCSEIKALKEE